MIDTIKTAQGVGDVLEGMSTCAREKREKEARMAHEGSATDGKREGSAQRKGLRWRKGFQLPHVYTIIFLLMVVFAVLTWIIPSGSYERQTIETAAGEREVAVAGTYQPTEKTYLDDETGKEVDLRTDLQELLMAPTQGIQAAADVVAFVLLIGGSFGIITKTNAINAGLSHVIGKLKDKDILIIPVSMLLLSVCGTTFGMSEEALPFYAIFIPIMMGLGYDSMTAFMICFMGPNIGYIASTVNPFNVLIAQGVVGIEGNPQLWLRAVVWVVFTVLAIVWVMRYARRVKRDPEAPSPMRTTSPSASSSPSATRASSSRSVRVRRACSWSLQRAWASSCGAL